MNKKSTSFNILQRPPTMNPQKSPKTSPQSSPRGNASPLPATPTERNSNRKASGSPVLNLQNLIQSLSVEKVPEPHVLKSPDLKRIEAFLNSFDLYKEHGGPRGLLEFIDKAMLSVFRELDMESPNATENEVLQHLRKECKPTSAEYIHEILQTEVRIDNTIISGKAKLQDLFASLTRTLKKLDISIEGDFKGGFMFSYERQMQLILSKLPQDFCEQYEIWAQYQPVAINHAQLYRQLITVEKHYTGNWIGKTQKVKRKLAFLVRWINSLKNIVLEKHGLTKLYCI